MLLPVKQFYVTAYVEKQSLKNEENRDEWILVDNRDEWILVENRDELVENRDNRILVENRDNWILVNSCHLRQKMFNFMYYWRKMYFYHKQWRTRSNATLTKKDEA